LLVLTTCAVQAAPLRVTLLLAEENTAYRDFAQSFTAEAARQSPPLKLSEASTLPSETDLIVAVGSKSLALALNSHAPVLSTLVSKSSFDKLLHDALSSRDKNSVSALYLDQPVKRHLALITVVLPEVKKIGLLFSAPSADIVNLQKAVANSRFSLLEQMLSSDDSLYRDLHSLLARSEVLLAIPDVRIYNPTSIRNILLETYRSNIPVIGFSPSYVKAGALCAVFSTPEQMAKQAVLLSKKFVETGALPAAQHPKEFEVMVNRQVANSLNIQIKEDLILLNKIKELESNSGGGK
jgi:ABC-type uncharacterized transport system substrate-binding protein